MRAPDWLRREPLRQPPHLQVALDCTAMPRCGPFSPLPRPLFFFLFLFLLLFSFVSCWAAFSLVQHLLYAMHGSLLCFSLPEFLPFIRPCLVCACA